MLEMCCCFGGLQAYAELISLLLKKIVFNLLLMLRSTCPTRHMGFGFVSHPLFLLHPPIVSALVASSLCHWFLRVHVLLVCEALTLHPCVLQYPVGSKIRSASAWVNVRPLG
jgi:hypothetical protein